MGMTREELKRRAAGSGHCRHIIVSMFRLHSVLCFSLMFCRIRTDISNLLLAVFIFFSIYHPSPEPSSPLSSSIRVCLKQMVRIK